jgi:hypothetical protein
MISKPTGTLSVTLYLLQFPVALLWFKFTAVGGGGGGEHFGKKNIM